MRRSLTFSLLPLFFLTIVLSACGENGTPATGANGDGAPGAGSTPATAAGLDTDRMLGHVEELASDRYEGRLTGTPAAERTRRYLIRHLEESGAVPCVAARPQPDSLSAWEHMAPVEEGSDRNLVNVVAVVPGAGGAADGSGAAGSPRIVVSAHYDHLGVRGGEIYNGADDNASGTALLLELARYVAAEPLQHTVVFAFFDYEEGGLRGARAFVDAPCGAGDIALNINLDMVSRSDEGMLYAVGTRHWPQLRPVLESVSVPDGMSLAFGHDEPGTGSDDWTFASDHAPFHRAGIPFVYFGVEDHAGYHQPTDDFDQITPEFYRAVGRFIPRVLEAFDAAQ